MRSSGAQQCSAKSARGVRFGCTFERRAVGGCLGGGDFTTASGDNVVKRGWHSANLEYNRALATFDRRATPGVACLRLSNQSNSSGGSDADREVACSDGSGA